MPTPDDIYPEDNVGLDELLWRSAPWGQDDWEAADGDAEDDSAEDEPEEDQDTVSEAPDVSAVSTENIMSDIPLKLKLLPGKIHLLNPKVHKLPIDSTYDETKVPTATPLKLRSKEGDWYYKTLSQGVHLPRPKNAPALFKNTKPSNLMDMVVKKWVENGLLIPNPHLRYL